MTTPVDLASKMMSAYFTGWQRLMTGPMEGAGKGERPRGSVPFPEQARRQAEANASAEPEDVHTRQFIKVLHHLSTLSNANSTIGHALLNLWLTRLTGQTNDATTASSRKEALHNLIAGCTTASREMLDGWAQVLTALTKPGL